MGSPVDEKGHDPDERSQHLVKIGYRFAVGKFETTFREWDACTEDGGCSGYRPPDAGWGRDRRPVINVSWQDAKAYVKWLGAKTGKPYRLLSEAEWEYVARAGTTTRFWTGQDLPANAANYQGAGKGEGKGDCGGRDRTIRVDCFRPNPFGLHHMHGNVWEWVEDYWQDNYFGAPADGSAWLHHVINDRLVRGGSWNNRRRFLRSANRTMLKPYKRSPHVGFRVARSLDH